MTTTRREKTLRRLRMQVESESQPVSSSDLAVVLIDGETAKDAKSEVLIPAIRNNESVATEVVESLEAYLEGEDLSTRHRALVGIAHIGSMHPGAIRPAIPGLVRCLEDEADGIVDLAAKILSNSPPSTAEDLIGAVDSIEPLLRSDLQYRRVRGAAIGNLIATADPEATYPLLDPLLDLLTMEVELDQEDPGFGSLDGMVKQEIERNRGKIQRQSEQLRHDAGQALLALADARPEAVGSRMESLFEAYDPDGNPHQATLILNIVARVADHRPERVRPIANKLCSTLGNDDDIIAGTATRALAFLAEEYPDEITGEVVKEINQVGELLGAEEAETRASAAALFSHLVQGFPEQTRRWQADLKECLEDDISFVRGNAAIALASFAGRETVELLETQYEREQDEEVRTVLEELLGIDQSG